LILQQAVVVVALELMRRRVERETERRLAGDVLAAALGGRLEAGELRRRLAPFGIEGEASVLVFSVDDPSALESTLELALAEARCALEATALDNGEAPDVASWQDLGAFTLLLSLQDDEALRLYCESVLGPIEDGDTEYGGELLRSLEAFIENNGQWERAAREVFCHRHTLRYRMRKVEELTGRDLGRAHDRIEFWLALRARELVT